MYSTGNSPLSNNADCLENGFLLSSQPIKESVDSDSSLPKIEAASCIAAEAKVLYAEDVSELKLSENPWTEEVSVKELPVFLAPEESNGLSDSDKKQIASSAAQTLNIEISSFPSGNSKSGDYVAICEDGSQISVTIDGTVQISGMPVSRPSVEIMGTSPRQSELKAGQYWYGVYEPFYQFAIPSFSMIPQGQSQESSSYKISVYEGAGNINDQILSYNLYNGTISIGAGEVIESLTYTTVSTAQTLGEYPLISADDAKQILLSEKYGAEVLSNVSLSAQDIQDVSLVYWTDTDYRQPVYRFLVSLDTQETPAAFDSKKKAYGEYFVPAVSPQYWI